MHDCPDQRAYNQERTHDLESRGLRVIRFTNQDILEGMPTVLDKIRQALAEYPLP